MPHVAAKISILIGSYSVKTISHVAAKILILVATA
jgi:hypothetical protein